MRLANLELIERARLVVGAAQEPHTSFTADEWKAVCVHIVPMLLCEIETLEILATANSASLEAASSKICEGASAAKRAVAKNRPARKRRGRR